MSSLPSLLLALLSPQESSGKTRPPEAAATPPAKSSPLFREDFEAFDPARWHDHKGALEVVEGGVRGKCLRITATRGEDTGGHLYRMLDEGLDHAFLRFYVRFEEDPGHPHHFVHLVGYRPGMRWPQGGAGERPRGDERFSTGIEPTGQWGRFEPPGAWNFYSYWCEMEAAPDGKYWGNSFLPDPPVLAVPDRWICVEIELKLNSEVDDSDGEQALWIDGREVGRWKGIRWRRHDELLVNGLWMLYYLTDQPDRHNRRQSRPVQRVWFDEIVLSRQRIGPLETADDGEDS